ncbi:MAG: putative lipid II flippase FtsW [Patescibacteria group bacterium]|jgi:cell division protein FtsW
MNTRKQHSDYWLALAIFALIVFGLIMIYSVSKYYSLQITDEATDKYFLKKQFLWAGIGIVVWIVFQSIDYRFWQKNSAKMLAITLVLLVLPIIFGRAGRWVSLGFTQFQPSEIAKLTFTFYLAGWMSGKGENLRAIRQMFWPFITIVGLVSGLMLVQKDLGTLAILVIISTSIFVAAGSSLLHLVAGAGLGGLLLWLAVKLEPYRMERVLTFLNPESNALGSGYHIRNALIAIGSGGVWGLGFGQSRQKYLYLPEAHTDSIFAIIAEELGLIRSMILIAVFMFIAMRGYKIAFEAQDQFSRLVAAAITSWVFFQAIINIAAMLSLVPLTGIPLPFVSYGGTSLVFLLAAVGVLCNISKHRKA